ncbi:sugar porter family MFS transporter [Agaribacter marinus]|uniref:MFS transporter n=1 Tax=Agaribacter marinus TaxID=1431249 RepID=A0AA37WK39_9ALTE|nr:sugar porter family MFS transporter [Agaribacter marinus]GLR70999.1 MFS transporter [Agaribacter marinus]
MNQPQRNALYYAFIVALGGFIFGLDIMLISGTHEYTTAEFNLTSLQLGNIAAGPGYGALIALLFAGYFSDKFGRKNTLIVIACLYTVSAIGSAFAPSYFWLFIARLIGGLAFTSLSLASIYIGEIAPARMRGKLVSMNQLNIVIGIFVATLINYFLVNTAQDAPAWAQAILLDEEHVWRWMLGIEIIPAAIWVVLLFMIPKSPHWLMLNGKQQEAESVMETIREPEEAIQEIRDIKTSLNETDHTPSMIQQAQLIFSKPMRIALLIGVFMALVQPLTGMNAMLAFQPMIFQQVGGDSSPFAQSVVVNLVGISFTVLAMLLIDKLGRRFILLGGLSVGAIAMAIVAFAFFNAVYVITPETLSAMGVSASDAMKFAPILNTEFFSDVAIREAVLGTVGEDLYNSVAGNLIISTASMNGTLVFIGIVTFVCAYNFSIGPILWILFSEVFPTKVRALAITGCAFITSVFGGVVVPTFFPWQLENMGAAITFTIYGSMCVIGLVAMASVLPETKGKSIEEIEEALKAKSLS